MSQGRCANWRAWDHTIIIILTINLFLNEQWTLLYLLHHHHMMDIVDMMDMVDMMACRGMAFTVRHTIQLVILDNGNTRKTHNMFMPGNAHLPCARHAQQVSKRIGQLFLLVHILKFHICRSHHQRVHSCISLAASITCLFNDTMQFIYGLLRSGTTRTQSNQQRQSRTGDTSDSGAAMYELH